MHHVTEAGLNLIKRFEGFSPTIYICPAGYPTIGYGHVVLAHEQEPFATGITSAQAIEFLRRDVGIAERAVLRLISVSLTDGQFDALVSFTFNLGTGALQCSTLRRKVNRRERKRPRRAYEVGLGGQENAPRTGWPQEGGGVGVRLDDLCRHGNERQCGQYEAKRMTYPPLYIKMVFSASVAPS